MASIKEERTRGKRLSYKFRVCLGRDENGRQISKAMRWNPPEDMTLAKAKKEAPPENFFSILKQNVFIGTSQRRSGKQMI